MTDPLLAVDVHCLNCLGAVLRIEAGPGDTVQMPAHECGA